MAVAPRTAAVVAVALWLGGCGDDPAQPMAVGEPPAARASADATALGVAFALPRMVAAAAYSSRSTVTEAVYFACAQTNAAWTGQVTTTGTITLSPIGAQYAPAPTDKLVVRAGAEVHEFEAITANGNNQADSAATWLQQPHRLTYLHRLPGKAEARVDEQFDGAQFSAHVTGWAELGGARYEVDLTARGASSGSGDFDGRQSQTRYDLTGTLRGNGVEVDVREQHTTEFASATSLRLLYSQRGWASQFRATLGSTVRSGGVAWQFADVQVETGAKEKGGQQTSDVVAVTGTILRDGHAFAQCTLQGGVAVATTGAGAIPLQLPGGF